MCFVLTPRMGLLTYTYAYNKHICINIIYAYEYVAFTAPSCNFLPWVLFTYEYMPHTPRPQHLALYIRIFIYIVLLHK